MKTYEEKEFFYGIVASIVIGIGLGLVMSGIAYVYLVSNNRAVAESDSAEIAQTSPTETPTPTETPRPRRTSTNIPTKTIAATLTKTPTETPTHTPTTTPSPEPTHTPTQTPQPTNTPTRTPVPIPSATNTLTPLPTLEAAQTIPLAAADLLVPLRRMANTNGLSLGENPTVIIEDAQITLAGTNSFFGQELSTEFVFDLSLEDGVLSTDLVSATSGRWTLPAPLQQKLQDSISAELLRNWRSQYPISQLTNLQIVDGVLQIEYR